MSSEGCVQRAGSQAPWGFQGGPQAADRWASRPSERPAECRQKQNSAELRPGAQEEGGPNLSVPSPPFRGPRGTRRGSRQPTGCPGQSIRVALLPGHLEEATSDTSGSQRRRRDGSTRESMSRSPDLNLLRVGRGYPQHPLAQPDPGDAMPWLPCPFLRANPEGSPVGSAQPLCGYLTPGCGERARKWMPSFSGGRWRGESPARGLHKESQLLGRGMGAAPTENGREVDKTSRHCPFGLPAPSCRQLFPARRHLARSLKTT